ncbi:MAG: DNA polymerase III subunit delta [Terriglobia bacterium]
MRPSEFCALLEKGKAGAVYFLRGPDHFLHEECRAAVIRSLAPATREWCFAEAEIEPGELTQQLEDACQMPMLGAHTFLYLTGHEDFGRATEEDGAALEAFLKRPPPFATVIFAAHQPDRRRRLIQLLEKKAAVVNLEPLNRHQACEWLRNYLRQEGVQVDPALAEHMVAKFAGAQRGQASGVNVLWLRTETQKLLAARPGLTHIEEPDMDVLVAFREEHEIGRLLTALARRDLSRALTTLNELLTGKEPETLILWCIADLFRQALKSSSHTSGRSAPWTQNPYSTYEIAPQALSVYSREELARALRLARGADLAIKSSWKDSKLLLESLLWQIVTGKQTARIGWWSEQAALE